MGIYLANLDLVGRFNYSDDTLTFTRPGAVLQAERDMVNFGTNIYDGACWQIVTRDWLSDDPFIGTPYFSTMREENLSKNPDYQRDKISWLHWKPIMGENFWAFLISLPNL